MPRITAILTSFNRREQTLACLAALRATAGDASAEVDAVLVDDGSNDGTGAAVRGAFPWVQVVDGDGTLFWTRGMHRAIAEALGSHRPDFLLWLNDDTMLSLDALRRLLSTEEEGKGAARSPVIVVGATCNPETGRLTYGGLVRTGFWRRMNFRKVHSMSESLSCDTMNGNVVLIPLPVAQRVGNLDPAFAHAAGDIDYGLRARGLGISIRVTAGFVGTCANNLPTGAFGDTALPLRQRWKHMQSRKGLPVATWLPLTRRHGGPLWPLYFAWPYMKLVASSLRAAVAGKRP